MTLRPQVKITGYHAVGSEGGGFVLFDIEIETLPSGVAAAVRPLVGLLAARLTRADFSHHVTANEDPYP